MQWEDELGCSLAMGSQKQSSIAVILAAATTHGYPPRLGTNRSGDKAWVRETRRKAARLGSMAFQMQREWGERKQREDDWTCCKILEPFIQSRALTEWGFFTSWIFARRGAPCRRFVRKPKITLLSAEGFSDNNKNEDVHATEGTEA